MKKILKTEYILAILISAGVFNSCTKRFVTDYITEKPTVVAEDNTRIPTASGNYLAGRIAHLRQDLNKAADFYAQAVDLGFNQPEIVSRTYLLLAFEGRINEAHKYAMQSWEQGDKNYVIRFLDMAQKVSAKDYAGARESLKDVKEEIYKTTIFPPFYAWLAVAEGHKDEALKLLSPLEKENELHALYYIHTGLINDYAGDTQAAQVAFDKVVNDESIELSFRSLQIISNFYVRNGQRQQAHDLIYKYYEKNNHPMMLADLYRQTKDGTDIPEKLIDTPQKGVAEALFNTGTAFRTYQNEIAQIFTVLALYLNPNHDVARVSVADLLEAGHKYEQAREEYAKIGTQSPIYFMAVYKIAALYIQEGKNLQALQQLENLNKLFPNNYQVLFNLGEICRVMDDEENAIKYYEQALKFLPDDKKSDWTILYALGVAYERHNEWEKAENVLKKALKISHRHPLVLNYLGYSWLKNNKNPNEALYMIFEAYHKSPEDGYIMDSLGWALFKMGKYEDSVKVLERAAEYLPDNAVICDHLGDAYWLTGREREAKYQWNHVFSLKDDTREVNLEEVKRKLNEGIVKTWSIPYNESLLVERLKTLNIKY